MKSEYNAVMLCFVQSFDGTLCHQTQGASDTNNNGQDKAKPSARKALLALGRDSKRALKRKELAGPDLTTVSEGGEAENCVKNPAPSMQREMKRSLSERPTEAGKKLSTNFRKTWSTGNFSAPVVSIGAPAPPAPRSAPTSPLQPPVVPAPSPHHDKSGKQASWSGGEAGPGAQEAAAGAGSLAAPAPGSHKARQKKFHRHFPQASLEERVLNYYSCALVGDILLQGHLYITKNYFAFYSNVFGYVTKLLIPLTSVVRVSKEKMARIIPNAVGVTTLEDKHVFASLLSRDTTYKLMTQVLKASPAPVIELSPSPQELRLTKGESEVSLDEDSSCCSQSGTEEGGRGVPVLGALPAPGLTSSHVRESSRLKGSRTPDIDAPVPGLVGVSAEFSRKPSIPALLVGSQGVRRRPGLSATPLPPPPASAHSLLLLAATALLVVLFLSAGLLLYRIGKVGAPESHIDDNVLMLKRGDDVYSQILKWHSQLHTKSAMQVHDFLHSNLDQIAKVRQSLETLSTLIGGIITDKMAPLDTRQGGYITRQGEQSSGESLRGNANS